MEGQTRSDLDEIRHRSNIVEVVSEYVTLRKAGRNFVGLCPFHREKTPSFSVNPEKQIFYCFGCGEGGNAIDDFERRGCIAVGWREMGDISAIGNPEALAQRRGMRPESRHAVDDAGDQHAAVAVAVSTMSCRSSNRIPKSWTSFGPRPAGSRRARASAAR